MNPRGYIPGEQPKRLTLVPVHCSGGTGGMRQAALEQVLVARFLKASRAGGGDCGVGGIFKVTIELQILYVPLFGKSHKLFKNIQNRYRESDSLHRG